MKSLWRVRSNSLTTLAVATPSTSRPVIPAPPRIPSKQLALPSPGIHPPLFPSTPPLSQNPVPVQVISQPENHSPRAHKRPRLKYQLDVGAYGIPKHRSRSHANHPHTALSVQVGEDAYFIRDNALGIADGVGGWAKHSSHIYPTPSALFARRLMHFCSEEMADPPSLPTAQFSFQHHLKPPSPFYQHQESVSDLQDSLSSSLEELSEGINVLQILERAYDSTVKAHLAPPTPLHTGSSTALLAVLDHPPPPNNNIPLPQSPEPPFRNYAAGSQPELQLAGQDKKPYDAVIRIAHLGDCMGMLIRGDQIAWRSDEMWWGVSIPFYFILPTFKNSTQYNQPLQLGPPSPLFPSTSLPVQPHTFTLPVHADDILILASDGLSDNLWDEDVLDEVLKFRDDFKETDSTVDQSHILRRKALAGMLSEALCSRAKRVSEMRTSSSKPTKQIMGSGSSLLIFPQLSIIPEEMNNPTTVSLLSSQSSSPAPSSSSSSPPTPTRSRSRSRSKSGNSPRTQTRHLQGTELDPETSIEANEIPFAFRAKQAGRVFRGGKQDGQFNSFSASLRYLPSPFLWWNGIQLIYTTLFFALFS